MMIMITIMLVLSVRLLIGILFENGKGKRA